MQLNRSRISILIGVAVIAMIVFALVASLSFEEILGFSAVLLGIVMIFAALFCAKRLNNIRHYMTALRGKHARIS